MAKLLAGVLIAAVCGGCLWALSSCDEARTHYDDLSAELEAFRTMPGTAIVSFQTYSETDRVGIRNSMVANTDFESVIAWYSQAAGERGWSIRCVNRRPPAWFVGLQKDGNFLIVAQEEGTPRSESSTSYLLLGTWGVPPPYSPCEWAGVPGRGELVNAPRDSAARPWSPG